MEHNEAVAYHAAQSLGIGYLDVADAYNQLGGEVLAVAKDMRNWMNDHRWLQAIDDWATRLEQAI